MPLSLLAKKLGKQPCLVACLLVCVSGDTHAQQAVIFRVMAVDLNNTLDVVSYLSQLRNTQTADVGSYQDFQPLKNTKTLISSHC